VNRDCLTNLEFFRFLCCDVRSAADSQRATFPSNIHHISNDFPLAPSAESRVGTPIDSHGQLFVKIENFLIDQRFFRPNWGPDRGALKSS
jgi:hypothetical protein